MPIHEFKCDECGHNTDYFFHTRDKVKYKVKCDMCGGVARRVLSSFNTGEGMFKKLSGVDDTDELTVGKIVADGKIPAEFKRPVRERIERYNKNKSAFEERKRELGFSEDGTVTN